MVIYIKLDNDNCNAYIPDKFVLFIMANEVSQCSIWILYGTLGIQSDMVLNNSIDTC